MRKRKRVKGMRKMDGVGKGIVGLDRIDTGHTHSDCNFDSSTLFIQVRFFFFLSFFFFTGGLA